MRRLFLTLMTLVMLLTAFTPVARAGEEWCDTDPLVVIETPGGALVPVYVTNGALGLEHLAAAQTATITTSVKSVENGRATQVKVEVLVPDDLFGSHFATRSVVSSGPLGTGTVFATTSGYSGEVMKMTFTLDVP